MIAHETGTGRPLFLVHGFEVDHRVLLPLEGALSESAWRRIYLNLAWVPPVADITARSAQEVADTLVREIRAHVGEEPFAILGNSFGAMLARYVVHEMGPQALGLATLVGVFVADTAKRVLPEHRVIVADPDAVHMAGSPIADYAETAVIQSPHTARAFTDLVVPALQHADRAVLARIASSYALDQEPEDAHPEPYDRPSLHVFGRQDQVTGFEDGLDARSHYPRGTFAVLDGAGHNAHLERPELFGALLTDWLARIDDDLNVQRATP